MLPEKKTKTNIGVGIGLILQLVGFGLVRRGGTTAILGLLLIVVSVVPFIWGCMNYAEGKGHSKWVGFVGLAGIIGLIGLIVLPEQDRDGSVPRLQLRKFVGLISMVAGLGLAVLARWLHELGEGIRLERQLPHQPHGPHPWTEVCGLLGFLGFCLVVGSLVLVLGNHSAHGGDDSMGTGAGKKK